MGKVLFHLAFPVTDLQEAKRFYVDGLGCELGRESSTALSLGLAGHQIVAQLTSRPLEPHATFFLEDPDDSAIFGEHEFGEVGDADEER